jgi:transposase
MSETYCLGVDPGKTNLTVCLLRDRQGAMALKPADFPTTRQGFESLLAELQKHLKAGDRLLAGVEASASLDDNVLAFFASLQERDWALKLMRVDAAQVAGFTGAKPIRGQTDKTDAKRVARFVASYADELHSFDHDPRAQAMLRLINDRAHLVDERVAWRNRLQDRLVLSFPEFTSVLPDPAGALGLAALKTVATAREAAGKRARTLARIKPPTARSQALGVERAEALLKAAQSSVAGANEPSGAQTIRFHAGQLETLDARIAEIEKQLKIYSAADLREAPEEAPRAQEEPENDESPRAQEEPQLNHTTPVLALPISKQIRLADSLPGFGLVGASVTVLRVRGIARYGSSKALAAQLGVCPDRVETGTSLKTSHLTHRGDRLTRSTLYLLTLAATRSDPAMTFHKWRHIRAGMTPKQAVCACMNRMVGWLYAVVMSQQPYDQNRSIANAQKQHPQLWEEFRKSREEQTA